MTKDVKILESQEVVLTFTYDAQEWKKAQEKENRKLMENLTIKGFRKGHVPEDIAKRYINQNEVINNAINNLVNKSYKEALDEGKYLIVTQPALSITKMDADGMVAEIRFSLPPVVNLGQYKGLNISEKAVRVTKEDIKKYIEQLRTDHATMVVKEDEAKLGDTVIIDFKGYINDSPFDGGEAKAYELKLGSNSFIPGFEDQLVGIKANENRSIEVTFPKNYVENLANKVARFEIHCSDVKETVLPEVDADFIEELNIKEVKAVEDLDAYAKKILTERKTNEANNNLLNEILNKVIETSEVKIGSGIIEEEAKASVARIKKQVEDNGLTFKDYLAINETTEVKLLDSQKEEALKNLKAYLVVEEICRKENIVVDEKALDEYYASLAKQFNLEVEKVKEELKPNLESVRSNLRSSLFNKFLLSENVVSKNKNEEKKEEEKSE